jgi:DNA-binding XRE family transcriptional regulator
MSRMTLLQSFAKYCIVCPMRFAHHLLEESRVFAEMERAELAALAGIIEAGRSVPRLKTALALAAALDIDHRNLWITEERAA